MVRKLRCFRDERLVENEMGIGTRTIAAICVPVVRHRLRREEETQCRRIVVGDAVRPCEIRGRGEVTGKVVLGREEKAIVVSRSPFLQEKRFAITRSRRRTQCSKVLEQAVIVQREEGAESVTYERSEVRRAWPVHGGATGATRHPSRERISLWVPAWAETSSVGCTRTLKPWIGFVVAPKVALLTPEVGRGNQPGRAQLFFHAQVVLHDVGWFDSLRIAEHQSIGQVCGLRG